jgi:hypothetical protein
VGGARTQFFKSLGDCANMFTLLEVVVVVVEVAVVVVVVVVIACKVLVPEGLKQFVLALLNDFN